MHIIDNLQYANWSEKIFKQMREGGVDAVHVTIAYHEMFREMVANIEQWNRWFEAFPHLICQGRSGDDVRRAKQDGRTAIISAFKTHRRLRMISGLSKFAIYWACGLCSLPITTSHYWQQVVTKPKITA